MDLTNENKYINNLFEQKRRLQKLSQQIKENFGLDSKADNLTMRIKSNGEDTLKLAAAKQFVLEHTDNDLVDVIFE